MKRRSKPPVDPKDSTGSPSQAEPVFIAVGFLRRSHGIQGEMLMDVLTDFPERMKAGRLVYVGEQHDPYRVDTVRLNNKTMLIKLKGFDNPEAVQRFRNQLVSIQTDQLPALPEDTYYHHQLLGMKVNDEAGNRIGELASILETGANDVYVVRDEDGKEFLFPAIEEVILEVNLERREIRVHPQEWV